MKGLLLTLSLAVLAGLPAAAHHSFAASYFEDQRISIQGEIVEFE